MLIVDCADALRPALTGALLILVLCGVGIFTGAEPFLVDALRRAVARRWARVRTLLRWRRAALAARRAGATRLA